MPPPTRSPAPDPLADQLHQWLPRQGRAWPGLVPLLDTAVHDAGTDHWQLLRALPLSIQAAWQAAEQQAAQAASLAGVAHEPLAWPQADAPWEQAERLIVKLLHQHGKAAEAGMLVAPATPPGPAGLPITLRDGWWLQALLHWRSQTLPPDPDLAPHGSQGIARIRLLLWDPYTGTGQVAQLTLRRVHAPGARLALVAAPASALTPCTASFVACLQAAAECARGLVHAPAVHDTAVAWDICAPEGLLWALHGPSAGGAVALALLWLLRAHVTDPALAAPLQRIELQALGNVLLSAALAPGGAFARVGHLREKVAALADLAATQRHGQRVYAAPADAQALAAQALPHITPEPVAGLQAMVAAVAQHGNALTTGQEELLQRLAAHSPLSEQPLEVDEALLTAVTSDDPIANPVRSLVQYALKRWAWWARVLRGQVHNLFVPLRLEPDSATLPQGLKLGGGTRQGLLQLLAEQPPRALGGFMLRGGPGAGKSTLLQRHEQLLCHLALHRWLQDGQLGELPLYLPLAGLEAGADPVAWLRNVVQQDHPGCAELHRLLQPARREPGDPALRLMLDGLNELPHAEHGSRNARAVQVLAALWKGVAPPLSLLLSARTHHVFDLRDWEYVAPVDVLPWSPAEIKRYIRRRFPVAEVAQRHVNSLDEHPHVLALCGVPFNLSGQCSLWEAGAQRLATSRADLYRRLLWQALQRELKRGTKSLLDDQLLTLADRQALLEPTDALDRDELPPWPSQGVLLPSLFRQGLAQWHQAALVQPGMAPGARGEVELPWDDPAHPERSVVHWLAAVPAPPGAAPLRERWRNAVRDLGLLDEMQAGGHTGAPHAQRRAQRFKWRHQSWGEFLASVTLLPTTPEDMSEPARQALCQQLGQGRGFERSAAAELQHLAHSAAERWNLPQLQPGGELRKNGITAPLAEVQQWLRENAGWGDADFAPAPPGHGGQGLGRFTALVEGQALILGGGGHNHATVTLNLELWLRVLDTAGPQFGNPTWQPSAQAWQRLALNHLWAPFASHFWQALGGEGVRQRLSEAPGRLQLRNRGDLDEVLGLALLGLADAGPWLAWLLQQGLWPALGPALQDLVRRREPQGPWQGPVCKHLQHLRRLLLLASVDAGPAARAPVQASGVLQRLHQDVQARGLPPEHAAQWQQALQAAFTQPGGVDLRLRLEAGLALGLLGDNLRYEEHAPTGWARPGLRLHPALWVPAGGPGQRHGIGSAPGDPDAEANEGPAWCADDLPPYLIASLPVTVGEWQRFVDAGGYHPAQPWWGDAAAGPAARAWLERRAKELAPEPVRPRTWRNPEYNNPLQPMSGITAYEAQAYAAWAGPLYAQGNSTMAVPSEVQWEAGVRGPWPDALPWAPEHQPRWAWAGDAPADPLRFNHAATAWWRPSPVGVFSLSTTPHGVADAHGNVLEWCCNITTGQGYDEPGRAAARAGWNGMDGESYRALRGGGRNLTATYCRVAYRLRRPPSLDLGFGVRLVRE